MVTSLKVGMFFKKLYLRIMLFSPRKRTSDQLADYQVDLTKSLDDYIEANEKYLQVASKFFSTSIEEDQKSLVKSAEDVLYHHAAAQLFTMVESINIFTRAANKIIASSDTISELVGWIESREKENSDTAGKLSSRMSKVGVYPIAKQLFIEQNFLRQTKLYLLGVFRVLLAYFQYIFEISFKELPKPTLLEQFQKRHKQSKLWLALPFVGLILNILGFIPLISFGTGVIGIVMFVIENYYLDGKELMNLKKMPNLAQEAQVQLETARINIDAVRNIRDFIIDLDTCLPQETIQVIDALKMRIDVDPKILDSQRELLTQKSLDNRDRVWPGIGAILNDNASDKIIENFKNYRKRHKRKHES